jgi:hypothetical protein
MKAVAVALLSRFNSTSATGHNSFYNLTGGQLYRSRAPANIVAPYSLFFIVSNAPDLTFTEEYRNIIVQFTHVSTLSSSTEADAVNEACNTLYNEQPRPVTGATTLWMRMTDSPGAEPADMETSEGKQGWLAQSDFDLVISLD